ncbi:hypothetical protein Golax_024194, partial [Gossypium laxum]|nr:hypothetical protein [Gossypium laxum]
MLGVCTPDMHFVYVLPGWKGFVVDGWILRDAISRRHGLKVPHAELGEGLPSNVIDENEPNIAKPNLESGIRQLFTTCVIEKTIAALDIVEEIDAEDVAIAKILEEENNYHGCEDDVSLDEMDVSATQSQPSTPNQDSSTFSKKKKKKDLWW